MIAVHNTFSLNWIFLSGFWISGNIAQNGLITSRNLMPMAAAVGGLQGAGVLVSVSESGVDARRSLFGLTGLRRSQH